MEVREEGMEVQEEAAIKFLYASCTHHFSTCTQHNFKNSKNIIYFGNENPKLKIIYSRKINLEEIFVFRI